MSFQSILSSIGTAFTNFFTKAPQVVDDAFGNANKIINIFKTFITTNPEAATLEAIVEAFAPGVSAAVFGALNVLFTDFGLVDKAVTGTVSEISALGLAAANKLTGDSRIQILNAVVSTVGHAISGGNSTLQQALAVNQVVYNPAVLSLPDAVATS